MAAREGLWLIEQPRSLVTALRSITCCKPARLHVTSTGRALTRHYADSNASRRPVRILSWRARTTRAPRVPSRLTGLTSPSRSTTSSQLPFMSIQQHWHISRGVKCQSLNKLLLLKKYFPRCLTQNNNKFLYGFAQIENRYKTVRALAVGSCPYSSRLNELLGSYRPYYIAC